MKEPSVGVGVRQPELPGIEDPRYRFRNMVLGFAKEAEPYTPNDSEPVYDPDFVTQANGLPVTPADGAIFRVTPLFRTLLAGVANVTGTPSTITTVISGGPSRLVLTNNSDYWVRVQYNGNDVDMQPRNTYTFETPQGLPSTATLTKLNGLSAVAVEVSYQYMGW
jgi:hypothetical protein